MAASGPKFEWTINLGNTVKEDVPVTEVDENTVVVDKTGVSLVGVKNEDGSFTVADYFTTDDNGVVSVAGELPPVDLALGDSSNEASGASDSSSNTPVILAGVGVVVVAAAGGAFYLRRRSSTDATS